MDHAGVAGQADGDAGIGEASGVGFSLVAEDVEAGRDDERGGKAGKIAGAERRSVGIGATGGVGDVLVPVPGHRRAGEQVAVGVFEI